MVLGYLLYEAVDVGVNVVKLSYNGIRGIYYWYYGEDYPEVEREKLLIKDIETLTDRLEKLEHKLEEKTNIPDET